MLILVEQPQEALFEDGGSEGVGENDNTVRRVGQGFHFLQTNLIQASGEEIDDVSIV